MVRDLFLPGDAQDVDSSGKLHDGRVLASIVPCELLLLEFW